LCGQVLHHLRVEVHQVVRLHQALHEVVVAVHHLRVEVHQVVRLHQGVVVVLAVEVLVVHPALKVVVHHLRLKQLHGTTLKILKRVVLKQEE